MFIICMCIRSLQGIHPLLGVRWIAGGGVGLSSSRLGVVDTKHQNPQYEIALAVRFYNTYS